MKSARERSDILAAQRDLGSYRAAAELCGTTPTTVRRVIAQPARSAASPSPASVRPGRCN